MTRLTVFILILNVVCLNLVHSAKEKRNGTTVNLKKIFISRCHTYNAIEYKTRGLPRVPLSCELMWKQFSGVFINKNACDVTLKSNMHRYISRIQQKLPPNKTMFWTNTYDVVHKYADKGRRFITIEDTIVGYLVDKLSWCGQKSGSGINYATCPARAECSTSAVGSYWTAASIEFAKQASGHVRVMLLGTDPTKRAYRAQSSFASYELPNLTKKVTKLTALVVHEFGKKRLESCGKGSLALLQQDVTSKGIKYECIDDPVDVMHILCSENPKAIECKRRHG